LSIVHKKSNILDKIILKIKSIKYLYNLFYYALIVFLFSNCSEVSNSIQITNEETGVNIFYITGDDISFEKYMSENPSPSYIALNTKINIEFPNKLPDSIICYDKVISSNDLIQYGGIISQPLNINKKKNSCTFNLEQNVNALTSSNSNDYKHGAIFRYILLECTRKNDVIKIAFVVSTDAY